jgi:hypothetical protein
VTTAIEDPHASGGDLRPKADQPASAERDPDRLLTERAKRLLPEREQAATPSEAALLDGGQGGGDLSPVVRRRHRE